MVDIGPEFERPIRELEKQLDELRTAALNAPVDLTAEIERLEARLKETIVETFSHLSRWQKVAVSRRDGRPQTSDYISLMCDDWVELHGDNNFGDDGAIASGFATIGAHKVLLIGHRKGKTLQERVKTNFGCAHPEGYRKALRKMRLAEKFGLPVVTLIDTPGAYPGIEAEERGQAQAIAENILEMSALRTPVVSVVIGEGGSGGALGIGVCDRLLILEYAYYSVISPEGCAAILWKSAEMAEKAADALQLAAPDLQRFGIADEIVSEPLGGAHRNPREMAATLSAAISRHLTELKQLSIDELLQRRYGKVRALGRYQELDPQSLETASQPR